MWERFVRFSKKIASAGGRAFWIGLPWIFLLVGVILLVLANYHVDESLNKKLHSLLNSLGTSVLAAGVFAVLLKSLQYIGLFRDELVLALKDEDFKELARSALHSPPSTLVELKAYFEPQLERFSNKNVLPLSEGLTLEHRRVLNVFSIDGYYRNFSRTIRITSFDSVNKILEIDDDFFLELIPMRQSETINYKSIVNSKNSNFGSGFLEINGRDMSDLVVVDQHSVSYSVPLSGSSSYKIKRRYHKTIDLRCDPYLNLRLTRPAVYLNVEIENHCPKDIFVIARGVGFNPDDSEAKYSINEYHRTMAGKKIKTMKLVKESLTMQEDGYFVVFGIL